MNEFSYFLLILVCLLFSASKTTLLRLTKENKKISSNKFQVLGNVSIHDFIKETGWSLPEERGESTSEIVF